MSSTSAVLARVSRLAAGQWGMLTTAQAARDGVTRLQLARLADAEVLERVGRGVYATTSSTGEYRTLRAAWLTLDPARSAEERLANLQTAGVVSHTSAAGLHRLGDLLDDEPEITLPNRKQTRRGIRLHRAALGDHEVTLVDGLPTTTAERTVADLLRDGQDPDQIAQIIGQGVRRGDIDTNDLAVQVQPFARRHAQPDGKALVEYLLDLVGLSPSALALELTRTAAGQHLLAASHARAVEGILASVIPETDLAAFTGMDLVRITGAKLDLAKIGQDLHTHPQLAEQLQQIASTISDPSMRSIAASMRFPAAEAVLAQRWAQVVRDSTQVPSAPELANGDDSARSTDRAPGSDAPAETPDSDGPGSS